MKKRQFFYGLTFCIFLLGCREKKETYSINENTIDTDCLQHLTAVIVHDIFSPPVASRIYAYSNLAWYEAIRFTELKSSSISENLKGFEKMPIPEKSEKYDYTLTAVASFFKVSSSLIFSKDSLLKQQRKYFTYFEEKLSDDVFKNSTELGNKIAAIILKRASTDQYKITRGMPKYSVHNRPGKWQQTPPDYADAAEPNWKLIQPLLLDSALQLKPTVPPEYNLSKQSKYYKELMEVYNTSKNLTTTQDTIAKFWDDNPFVTAHEGHLLFANKKITPGGHWMGITTTLCKKANLSRIETSALHTLTAAAIFDAFIVCWAEKYRSEMVRPITVIREHIDPVWEAKLQTPPFPEYPSGHSVITAAASTVLTHYLGTNFSFIDSTEYKYLGLVRSFSSIEAAADETGISRLYGGIHYRSAIVEGKNLGVRIGALYTTFSTSLEKLKTETPL
jgi:hypothetical protein